MKAWTIFIGGRPYVVKAEKCDEDKGLLLFYIADEVIGRFALARMDGYISEVKG